MPEHIVLSPFSFVGFELCNKLMEEGVEVIGVDLPIWVDPLEKEEKELFLGRNSNFTLKKQEQMIDERKGEFFLYISDIDVECEEWLEYIEKIPKTNEDTFIYVVMDRDWLKNDRIPNRVNTTIILPTIYGPWQPVDTFFYKCFSQDQFPFEQYVQEYRRDAIYISDASTVILTISRLDDGIFQVYTDIEKHWDLLLKEMGYQIMVDDVEMRNPISQNQGIQQYMAVTKISPHEGIDLVKKHIRVREILRY